MKLLIFYKTTESSHDWNSQVVFYKIISTVLKSVTELNNRVVISPDPLNRALTDGNIVGATA